MGIQTSNITTASNGDLSLDPNGTGKVVLPDLSAKGEVPMSVDNDGNIKPLDEREFSELSALDPGDFVMVQRADGYYKVDATNLGGLSFADPVPGDLTWSPSTPPGSGTQADPYRLASATVAQPGGSVRSVESVVVANQKPDSLLLINEIGGTSGIRFNQPAQLLDNAGSTASFNFGYLDAPDSTTGQVYSGLMKLGNSSVYVSWDVTQRAVSTNFGPASAPTASPTSVNYAVDGKYGTVSATWSDGDFTLTAADMVFSVNGGGLNSSQKTVSDGDTVVVGFVDANVAAAANGATITGTLQSTDGAYFSEFEMVKDTVPAPFTIVPLIDQATSDVVTTGNNPLLAVNAPTEIAAPVGGTDPLTSVEVSVNGGAFTSSYPVTFNPGDSLQARGTTGATAGTEYTTTFTIGGTSSVLSVTTGAATDLVQPQITNPPNFDGNDQASDVAITSTDAAYVDGSTIVHQESDWQAYKALAGASPEFLESDIITASPGADGTTEQTLTLASDEGFDNFQVGNEVEQDGSYQPVSSMIENVNQLSFSAVYTGTPYSGYEGPNSFDVAEDKLSFPAGVGQLDNSANQKSTRATLNDSIVIMFNKNIEVNDSLWVLFQSEYQGTGDLSTTPRIVIEGTTGTQTVSRFGEPVLAGGTYGWGQVDHTLVGDITKITIISTSSVAGLAQVKVDGINVVEGNYAIVLTTTNATDLKYMEVGDVVQGLAEVPARESNNSTPYDGATDSTIPFGTVENSSTTGVWWIKREDFVDNPVTLQYISGDNLYINGYPTATALGTSTLLYTGTGTFVIDSNVAEPYVRIYAGGSAVTGANFSFTRNAPAVKVVSTNPVSNTMTVDGGDWTGSDGTSSGEAADRETKVTVKGPLKLGKGKVKSLNAGANQMTIEDVSSVWVANDNGGSGTGTPETFKVRDPLIEGAPVPPTTNPPNPANYTLHEESMGDTANLTSWKPTTAFDLDSTVFTRVKHRDDSANESEYSPWSGFKVKNDIFDQLRTTPGDIWVNKANDGTNLTKMTVSDPSVLFDNLQTSYNPGKVLAIGDDRKIYSTPLGDFNSAFTVDQTYDAELAGSPPVDIWLAYRQGGVCILTEDSIAHYYHPSVGWTQLQNVEKLNKLGSVLNVILVTSKTGEFYCIGGDSAASNGVLELPISYDSWLKVDLSLPAGVTLKTAVGSGTNYIVNNLTCLTDDGDLYYFDGTTSNRTVVTPVAGKSWKDISLVAAQHIFVLSTDGELWTRNVASSAGTQPSVTGQPPGPDYIQIGTDNDWESCGISEHSYGDLKNWFAVKNGRLWGATESTSATDVNPPGISPIGSWGTNPQSMNAFAQGIYMILPR